MAPDCKKGEAVNCGKCKISEPPSFTFEKIMYFGTVLVYAIFNSLLLEHE